MYSSSGDKKYYEKIKAYFFFFGTCNSLIIIEYISTDGSVLPSFIIFKGKELMEDWFTHNTELT